MPEVGSIVDISQHLAVAKLQREIEDMQLHLEGLKSGDGSGTNSGMDRIWDKLAEHDRSLTRLEGAISNVATKVDGIVPWIVGTAIASFAVLAALVVGLWTYSANRNSEAMTAIQTVLAARPSEPAPAQQPTIIVVPSPGYTPPVIPKSDQPAK